MALDDALTQVNREGTGHGMISWRGQTPRVGGQGQPYTR
jgi:hypothetical protein